jgi:hypothetical protein
MKIDRTKTHNSISEDKYKKANSLFRECKEFFGDIFDNWNDDVADEEEREFYRLLSNYFLQQRQKEVIDKRLF